MTRVLFSKNIRLLAMVVAAGFLFVAPSFAQGGGDNGRGAGGPQITDAKEAAAFQAYEQAKGDKKIQAGVAFVNSYPKSVAAGRVADQVVSLSYGRKDWSDFDAMTDKALAINPDDVVVLPLAGWVIPRNIKDGDPDTQKKLDKAEGYDKHAIDVISTMAEPATLTDEQFSSLKAAALSEAHSGLGLVYAREQKPEDAIAQFTQVTKPDATDLFMLGASYEMTGKHAEAAAQFQKCSAMSGPLQAPCQQNAADTAKEQ